MKQEAVERIRALRELYMQSPVFVDRVTFNRARRQKLNYLRDLSENYLNRSLYSMRMRKAHADAYLLDNMEPVIHDGELLVGLPDLTPLTPEEQAELDTLETANRMAPTDAPITAAHMALDYRKLIKIGVQGILDEVNCRAGALDPNLPENIEKIEFYDCCRMELEALVRLQHRYEAKARELASTATGKRRAELLDIAEMMSQVPEKPARTFREGLESMHFYNVMLWDLFYFGRVDQYLIDLYNADLAAGRITHEDAVELYACFLLLPEAYILPNVALDAMVGGTDAYGNTVENEVTHIAIEAIEYARSANGKVSLAVTDGTSDALLRKAIRLNAIGCAQPAFFNDRVIIEGFRRMGVPDCDAHEYCNTGCVEMTPVGKSGIHVVSPYHNLPAILLRAMKECADAKDFEEFFRGFSRVLAEEIAYRNLYRNRAQMERARNGREPYRASCLIEDCLARGAAVDAGGARYNFVEPNFLGFSNTVDSLVVIAKLVYESGELTLPELSAICERDFAGEEVLLAKIINKLPHYGTDDPFADGMAKRVSGAILDGCKGQFTYRGSFLVPGAFSYWEHATHGSRTGATPDGRRAGYPLSSGSSPVQGRETKGPTAAMLSCLSWDQADFMGGLATNMKFTPSCMQDDAEGKMLAFVRTFMRLGGFQLQLNAVSRETLLDAREHPEAHRDLLVRVGGFSAYFVKLSPEMQQEIIDRNEHTL